MDFAEIMLPLVRETRALSLPHYGVAEVKHKKSGSAHDVVTEIDHRIEKFLAEKLREVDPHAGFTGEEFGGSTDGDVFWICDPIDGTAHFIRGLPFCTTMLARIEDGQVVFAAIYDFVNDIMYHAEKGKGAFANGERIRVSTRSAKDWYMTWSAHLDKKENLERFVRMRELAVLAKFVSCGYEYAMIASGKLDGRADFDSYCQDWDVAPGSLLVAEAGGIVANLGTRSYDYRNHDFIAANPAVFEALTQGDGAIFPIKE